MIDKIVADPGGFHTNRAFTPAAIQTFAKYVKDTTLRLKSNAVPAGDEKHLLALARDMEQSILEAKFNEIVMTADLGFQTLMRQVVAETQIHRSRIAGRLAGKSPR